MESPEELKKILDLAGKATYRQLVPTALKIDQWGMARGKEAVNKSKSLQELLGWKGAWGGENSKSLRLTIDAAADFFGAAFEPDPTLHDEDKYLCVDEHRYNFIKTMLETPEYLALHVNTMLDEFASEIAVHHFAKQYSKLWESVKHLPSPKTEDDKMREEMSIVRAIAVAVNDAKEEVREAKGIMAAMGMGPGSPGSSDPKAIAELYKRARESDKLRKICDLAGPFRMLAQSKQRQRSCHGSDDVVGVTLGGDVARLTATELALLTDDEFELDAMRRLGDNQAQCREYKSLEPEPKSAIIVTVDGSGSMFCNDKFKTAMAFALAMAYIARTQKRWCGLIQYSGDTGHKMISLPPGRWNENALVDWLCTAIGGGSCLDVPIRELPAFYKEIGAPNGKTDLIMITDAICNVSKANAETFNLWKKDVKAKVISLVIGTNGGSLSLLSDEVHCMPVINVNELGIHSALSI